MFKIYDPPDEPEQPQEFIPRKPRRQPRKGGAIVTKFTNGEGEQ